MQCAEELVRGHRRKGNWLLYVCLPEGLVAWDIIARYISLVLICISMLGSLGHYQDLWLAVKVPLFGGSVRHRLAVAVVTSHRLRRRAAASAQVARPGPLSMGSPLKHHLDVLTLALEAQRGHDARRGLPHIVTGLGGIGATELCERLS